MSGSFFSIARVKMPICSKARNAGKKFLAAVTESFETIIQPDTFLVKILLE